MMTPFWFVSGPSTDTRIAVAARHGDAERLTDAVLRLWDARREARDAIAAEARAAEGNAIYPGTNFGEGCDLGHLFQEMGLSPRGDLLGMEFVTVPDPAHRDGWLVISAPLPSDLDDAGVCRCGCGYVAPPIPPPPAPAVFVEHGAAI